MNLEQALKFLPYIAIFGVFYFLIIRPQAKRRKEEKQFTESLKVGDKIITTSGIHGKVNQINTEKGTILLETGAGKMTLERTAISQELSKKLQTKVIEKN
ncbi:MAG: preprotein translocase subunit YajC [Nonlabens sp.]